MRQTGRTCRGGARGQRAAVSISDAETARLQAIELARVSLARCAPVAEDHGVTLCVENIYLREPEILISYAEYNRLLDDLGSPNVGFTLDIGHANVATGIPSAIRALGEKIQHVHIHDNHGETDEHLEMGTGSIDLGQCSGFLKAFPHMITLETRGPRDEEGTVIRSGRLLESILSG